MMRDALLPAFERFLLEDVILTLGNLRASLAWLADAESRLPPVALGAGLDRLGRQIDVLEDRARAVCRDIRGRRPVGAHPAPAACAEAKDLSLEDLLRDALGGEVQPPPAPVFRTRRAADG